MVRPTPDGGAVAVDQTATDTAKDNFNDYAAKFENTVAPLGVCHDNLAAGAGEFAGSIAAGNAAFLLGWRETLMACSETCGIIAGNAGAYYLDLKKVDVDQAVTVTI